MRSVALAILTAAVTLGALFLLWQVRTFVGWFVIALFLAAVLNPAVDWLPRRHRLVKRPLPIVLTYLGGVGAVAFLGVARASGGATGQMSVVAGIFKKQSSHG